MELTDISPDVRALNPDLEQLVGQEKPSKYHNRRITACGRTFASGAEAVRAGELMLLLKVKEIFCLEFQVSFPLPGGSKYVADFVYLDSRLRVVVEDVKGFPTREYKLKKKLFQETYGAEITEIKGL